MNKVIFVDQEETKEADFKAIEFTYKNADGAEEHVSVSTKVFEESFDNRVVHICDSGGDAVIIYVGDIPKLVKALERAHLYATSDI